MNENLFCPNCKRIISLRSSLLYDDVHVTILGVMYLIRCEYCKKTFVSQLRKGVNYEVNNEDD